jgi:hypothetical protein
MPILAQNDSHPKRRRPRLWVLLAVPGLVVLLLVGLVAWSWDRPVTVRFADQALYCGYTYQIPIAANRPSIWGGHIWSGQLFWRGPNPRYDEAFTIRLSRVKDKFGQPYFVLLRIDRY